MNKIAIVKLSSLGDIVHAMIGLQFIKARYPKMQIDWLVEERFAGLLHGNKHIDNILTVNLTNVKAHKNSVFTEIKNVRHYSKENYDLVIDAQGLLKSAISARLLGKNVAGFDSKSSRESLTSYFYKQKISYAYEENTIDRNANVLAQSLNFSISPKEILAKEPFLFYHANQIDLNTFIEPDKVNILFVTGSSTTSRNYPAAKFVEIANTLQQNCLVIWGNENERVTAESMAAQSSFIRVLPKLDLNALKAVVAHVDLVIGNDTGPTHIAWGLNKPSITLFGNTPVSRVYQTKINKVLKSSSSVNPRKLDKHDNSIQEIKTEDVIRLSRELIYL